MKKKNKKNENENDVLLLAVISLLPVALYAFDVLYARNQSCKKIKLLNEINHKLSFLHPPHAHPKPLPSCDCRKCKKRNPNHCQH